MTDAHRSRPDFQSSDFGGPWIGLVWLGFLLVPAQHLDGRDWLITAATLPVFLLLHFNSFSSSGPRLWLARASMFVIGVLLFPYNPFAHTYFIYAGLPGARSSNRESLYIIGLVTAGAYGYFIWAGLGGIYFGLISVLILGLGIVILLARNDRIAKGMLARKDVEIERLAKVAERERIARDLHDLLGHTLSLIAIKADLAEKLVPSDPAQAALEMRDIAAVSRNALSEVRDTISGLRSVRLDVAIDAASSAMRAAGVHVEVQRCLLPALDRRVEEALAQVVLEASTNVVRHAEAAQVSITLATEPDSIRAWIEDDGRGGGITPGNGLIGMRQRLAALGGTLDIFQPARGTRLVATIPLPVLS